MKRIILDQALSLLCAGILMFGIPFACNGVILPIVIMEAIVLFNTVLLYPIALFLPLDLILGPRTEEAFFSRRALTFQCDFFRKYLYIEGKFMCNGKRLCLIFPACRKAEDLNHVPLPPKDTRLRITYYRFTIILKSYEVIGPAPREKKRRKKK